MNDESIRRYKEANEELERVLESLVEDVKNNHSSDPHIDEWIKQIRRSQDAWKSFRDQDQLVAGFYWRGGGTGRAQTDWATKLTLQRIKDLEKRYNPK